MRIILRFLVIAIVFLAVIATSAWGSLALWYRLPTHDEIRTIVAGVFGVLGAVTAIAIFTAYRFHALVVFALAFGAILAWWGTILPPAEGEWKPSVARQVTGTRDGDVVTLTNVRNFEWRGEDDFTPQWETRSYDLSKIRGVDLFMSYWAGPEMAHVMLSFGFEGGKYLAWSIEVRSLAGGKFSPVADLFKSNPLVIVAADERDVVGVRSNVRGEDVQIYRLKASPEAARALFLEYVADANSLSEQPQFYNSLSTNCTTTVVKLIRAVGDKIPFDWRLIVNGYLPEYAYDRGALDTRLPLSEIRQKAHVDERAKAAGLTADYSRLIRVGVPSPLEP